MRLEIVSIPSGEVSLSGLLYLPDGEARSTALLFAHGFTSGKYSLDGLANYLTGRGYIGLTFDFVGHKLGGSGGEMHTIVQAAENLRDALHWLRNHTEVEKVVLIGHSLGAAVTLQVAAWEQESPGQPPLAGIACLCMGNDPARGFDSLIGQKMLQQRQAYVAGTPALQLLQAIPTLLPTNQQLADLPVLFIAAKQDVLVSVNRVEALSQQVGTNASFVVVESSHLEAPDRSKAALSQWLEGLL